jgi:hypothetical protein
MEGNCLLNFPETVTGALCREGLDHIMLRWPVTKKGDADLSIFRMEQLSMLKN